LLLVLGIGAIVHQKGRVEICADRVALSGLLEALNLRTKLAHIELRATCLINALELHLDLVDPGLELLLTRGIFAPE